MFPLNHRFAHLVPHPDFQRLHPVRFDALTQVHLMARVRVLGQDRPLLAFHVRGKDDLFRHFRQPLVQRVQVLLPVKVRFDASEAFLVRRFQLLEQQPHDLHDFQRFAPFRPFVPGVSDLSRFLDVLLMSLKDQVVVIGCDVLHLDLEQLCQEADGCAQCAWFRRLRCQRRIEATADPDLVHLIASQIQIRIVGRIQRHE